MWRPRLARALLALSVAAGLLLPHSGCGGGGCRRGGGLPVVTVEAPDATATEGAGRADTAILRLRRSGSARAGLSVEVRIGGAASNDAGEDFEEAPLGPVVEFLPGSSTLDLVVTPLDDTLVEGRETLSLRIEPSPGAYRVGRDAAAVVDLVDDDALDGDLPVVEAAALVAASVGDPLFFILDVRTPGEFAAGHLENAWNIDYFASDFADRIAELDPAGRYLVYCGSGVRSAAARDLLIPLNPREVWNMLGGIAAWQAAGHPVVTD